jgi:hypothetical protein
MQNKEIINKFNSEEILLGDDDDAIYGFYYIVDGEIIQNDMYDGDIGEFKRIYQCDEVRRCDVFERNII